MTPRGQLRIADGLMLAGLAPLAVGVAWVGGVMSWARSHPGQMGGEVFILMAVLLITYLFALVVSGGALAWATSIRRRHADAGTPWTTLVMGGTGIVLVLPLLFYVGVVLLN